MTPHSATFACDSLDISTLEIERCVVPGDQAELDAGNVVRVDRLSTPTVHWLAGHRTSHGATFRDLTGLKLGDHLTFRDAHYSIVEYKLVNRFEPGDVVDWSRGPEPSVVLQTSQTDTYVHVWRATAATSTLPSRPPVPDPPRPVQPPRSVRPVHDEHRDNVHVARSLVSFVTARHISDHVEWARSTASDATGTPDHPRTTRTHTPRPPARRPA